MAEGPKTRSISPPPLEEIARANPFGDMAGLTLSALSLSSLLLLSPTLLLLLSLFSSKYFLQHLKF